MRIGEVLTMTVYIKREDAIDTVLDVYYNTPDIDLSGERLEAAILNIPAADVVGGGAAWTETQTTAKK